MNKRTRVLAFGTFDIVHAGHAKYLEESRKLGGKTAELIVVIARDSTVKTLKGRDPIFPEEQRRYLVESLKSVDKAILGYGGEDRLRIVEELRPDIIALGYDEKPSEDFLKQELKKRGLQGTKVVRLSKYGDEVLNSTSKVVKRIYEVITKIK
ncbi:MAG: adenylyltransferase/cytidyltransferase family protein [Candidatus Atabeyarchaeum deiterrae]|jgi:FAD synthetase